jgi:hypothetical protein
MENHTLDTFLITQLSTHQLNRLELLYQRYNNHHNKKSDIFRDRKKTTRFIERFYIFWKKKVLLKENNTKRNKCAVQCTCRRYVTCEGDTNNYKCGWKSTKMISEVQKTHLVNSTAQESHYGSSKYIEEFNLKCMKLLHCKP